MGLLDRLRGKDPDPVSVTVSSHTIDVTGDPGAEDLRRVTQEAVADGVVTADEQAQIAEATRKLLQARGMGGALTAVPPSPAAAATDVVEQLQKLSDLRDRGALTDEEFAAQKARLLGT